jgi:hypothetical protein
VLCVNLRDHLENYPHLVPDIETFVCVHMYTIELCIFDVCLFYVYIVCICAHVCVYIWFYTCVYVCIYIHMYVCIYIPVNVCVRKCIHEGPRTYMHTHT